MVDDDVICSPDYLAGIRTVFADACIHGAQGRIFLHCDGGLPEWMGNDLARFMSLRDYGDQQLEWNQNLAGTNMVVRAAAIYEVGGYAPELGAGSLGYCEDSELSIRIRGAGFRLIYAPQIVVYHQLSRARLTKSFFRRRFFGFGRSQAYYDRLSVPLWRFTAYTIKQVLRNYFLAAWSAVCGRAAASLSLECEALTLAGFSWQHWQFKRGISPHLSRVEIRR
jgi:GT2 family glycosyltransferase